MAIYIIWMVVQKAFMISQMLVKTWEIDGNFILSDLSNVTKGSSYDIDYWKLGCAAMELITGKQFIVYKYHSDTFIEDSINDTGITDDKLRQFLMYCFSFSPDMPGRLDWINNTQEELSKDIIVWTMVNDFSVIERDGKSLPPRGGI